MRLLIKIFPALVLLLFSCKPQGPLTPIESFISLKQAVKNSDPEALESLATVKSLEKLRDMVGMFSAMSQGQAEYIAGRLNADPQRIKGMTLKEYLYFYLKSREMSGTLREAVMSRPVTVDKGDGRAVIRVDNGMELHFLKEGPYWKFDLSRY